MQQSGKAGVIAKANGRSEMSLTSKVKKPSTRWKKITSRAKYTIMQSMVK